MWQGVLRREEKELQREMSVYDDILVVNVVDVYRNLPRKLLMFYSWYAQRFIFGCYLLFCLTVCLLMKDICLVSSIHCHV